MSVFFYQPQVAEGNHFLEEEESLHCYRVLRKRPGDEILVMDGKGSHYRARLTTSTARRCDFEITDSVIFAPDPYIVHLAISPTKNADRIEWMTEKCVELGMHKLTLIHCDHSERTRFRTDRLFKKMISAMKQSGRAFAPELTEEVLPFDEFLRQMPDNIEVNMAYIDKNGNTVALKDQPLKSDCCVLIGPEGDFSEAEIALASSLGIRMVSLGPRRLRTETAGLAAVHIQMMKMQ